MKHTLSDITITTTEWSTRTLVVKATCCYCGYRRGIGKVIGNREWGPEDTAPMMEELKLFFGDEECIYTSNFNEDYYDERGHGEW